MMAATLLKEPNIAPSHDRVTRVTQAHLSRIAADLRRILMEDNAFKAWEAEAIANIVVEALRKNEKLTPDDWQRRLHSKGFPKDLAHDLGSRLSAK